MSRLLQPGYNLAATQTQAQEQSQTQPQQPQTHQQELQAKLQAARARKIRMKLNLSFIRDREIRDIKVESYERRTEANDNLIKVHAEILDRFNSIAAPIWVRQVILSTGIEFVFFERYLLEQKLTQANKEVDQQLEEAMNDCNNTMLEATERERSQLEELEEWVMEIKETIEETWRDEVGEAHDDMRDALAAEERANRDREESRSRFEALRRRWEQMNISTEGDETDPSEVDMEISDGESP